MRSSQTPLQTDRPPCVGQPVIPLSDSCSFCVLLPIRKGMSLFERSLAGKQIHSVHVDSEVTCLMLTDGTQVTIRGWVVVESRSASHSLELPTVAAGPEGTICTVKDSRPPA